MKIAVTIRYKYDQDGDGIHYTTNDNKKMFRNNGVELFTINEINDIEKALIECDGLFIPGGVDMNPKFYNEEINGTAQFFTWMDELDIAAIKAFYEKDKPILGICRGLQVINVCFGGTLYQDIADHRGTWHNVHLKKDSFVEKIYHSDTIRVNSWHHQAIKDLAPGFEVIATSDDGIIEAIKYKNIYAVQWHPEMYDPDCFIRYFIENIFNK